MKASHSWLQTYFKDPLPKPDALAALLTEHVFEVEDIENVEHDAVYDFKVLPDRAHHLLSHRGLAREIGVITNTTIQDAPQKEIPDAGAGTVALTIDNQEFCRRLVLRRFSGFKGETPELIKMRLEAVGQKSINALVDISNYVMFDIGQPSHVLDADKVRGGLVVRNAKSGERMAILGGKTIDLHVADVVIADDEGPLELAGVKGGERAAVTDETKNIIVHCGNYAPTTIRRTSTRLNLRSDASKRFENEITATLAEEGMVHLSALILETCPDAKAGAIVDVYPVARKVDTFTVTASGISAMLGEVVDAKEITELLTRMDCVVEVDGEAIHVTPPSDRFDLAIPEDVADEVGRIRGYNRLLGVLPPELSEKQSQDKLFWYGEKIKSVLVARGYSEVLLYAFGEKGSIEIEYPLASDKAFLRESLGERMAEKLAFNKNNADLLGLDAIKLCEVGEVFPATGERAAFALGVTLTRKRKGEAAEDIIREDLHALSEALGIEVPDTTDTVKTGAVCEVNLSALLEKLPEPGTLADLTFEHLSKDAKYQPIIPYPFVTRDVAVFVPDGITRDVIHEVIMKSAGSLQVRSWAFDEFVKEENGVTRHSYAFRIVFQSAERTLEDKEVNEVMVGVEKALHDAGWEVR